MVQQPNQKLIDLLNKYIPEEGEIPAGGDNILKTFHNVQNPEMLIPVLGLQGVGKSTLINGILNENIMPNEADETTCIPVEVRYNPESSVQVHFQGGRSENIATHEICEYVDNNYNRGNEKQVSHVVIYRNNHLLKSGIVLVDLPGVGSLTQSNQETTKKYIRNLYSAIFVIRVNPPITRTEATFIRLAWSTLSNAWFVQNRWNNENDREVAEGLEANITILKDIAEKNHTPYYNEVLTVNAYQALKGITQNKPDLVEASNIASVLNKLSAIHSGWKELADRNYFSKTRSTIETAQVIMRDLLEKSKLTKEELTIKLQKEEADFIANTDRIQKQVNEVKGLLEQQKLEAGTFIKKIVRVAEENIRVNIYRIIDGGVVDGEDLTQAFTDYQNQEFELAYEEYIDFIGIKTAELSEKIEEINELIRSENKNDFYAEAFSKKQELKWEKGLDTGIRIGGGVGGVLVGLKAGAVVGSFFAPPVGTIVGGVVGTIAGTIVGIFASFIGGGSKKLVMGERAKATKRQISPVIDEICEKIQAQLIESYHNVCSDIISILEQYYRDRVDMAEKQKKENIMLLRNNDNSEQAILELTNDLLFMQEQGAFYHGK